MDTDFSTSTWQGRLVRLRAVEPADWETYFAWNLDDEQARAVYWVPLPQSREAVRRWAEQESLRRTNDDNFRFAVVRTTDDAMVGDLTVHEADPRVGTLTYGITIKREERRKGYASEAILLALRFYFQERRYQKVTVRIYSNNDPSIALHERLGFQLEGRLRRMVYSRGTYYDQHLYWMTVEEYRERHLTAAAPA